MSHARIPAMVAALFVFLSNTSFGMDVSELKLKPFGNLVTDFGQLVKGYDKSTGDIENIWIEKMYLGFGLQALLSPSDTIRGALEMKMFNEFPRKANLGATRRLYHYPYMKEAHYIHSFLSGDALSLSTGMGYFPYKYNKDVRNLGEYLFRSTPYPQTLSTEFEFAYARLLGVYGKGRYCFSLLNMPTTLTTDLIWSFNQEWIGIHDMNAALLSAWNINDIFEIGAGASFSSFLSADTNATRPEQLSTSYIDKKTGDTLNYTFAGTKLMLRASFDPKKLFTKNGFGGFLGKEDLKIYTEAALLGVKNYPSSLKAPIWYMSPMERIPMTFGMNWFNYPLLSYPVTLIPEIVDYTKDMQNKDALYEKDKGALGKRNSKLIVSSGLVLATTAASWLAETFFKKNLRLDVLSFEVEWWGNRYPNNMEGIVVDGVPLPFREGVDNVDSTLYKGDNWKWSIYGSKTFAEHYLISFQIASDHMRTFALDWQRQDWEESLRSWERWYYTIRAGIVF